MTKIVDGFVFYNELNLLQFKLHELNETVDHFVIVEATKTFSGKDKPLFFQENKHLFKPFLHKIVHVIVNDIPETDDPWTREKHQRNAIKRGLTALNLSPDDIFILSDCDEIADSETLKKYRDQKIDYICALEQDLYYYNLNCRFSDIKWYHPKIMRYSEVINCSDLDSIRLSSRPIINRGGWHFSYFGDVDFIANKIKMCSHQEYNTEEYTSEEFLKSCITDKKRIVGPGTITYTETFENDYLPKKYKMLQIEKTSDSQNKLRIVQVTPGMIPIPPNGWGAVEKIIWNYKLQLEKLGHRVDVKYVNEVDGFEDVVHVHIANLALDLAKRGIPYIFSLHDHHVVHYGRGSFNYNQNLEAIKKSVISITHAEFLVNYFEETDKLFFLPHGVDTEYFKPDNREKTEHKLLCLANNGLAGDSSYDRKGFLYAIEAAKALNLPITVAGPENNLEFFKHYPEHAKYEKLTLRCDSPKEDDILELYRSHTIFLHPSMLEAGHPNLTLLEAVSSGIPVVGTYEGTKKIPGLIKIKRDVNSVISGIVEASERYSDLILEIQETRKEYDWQNITNRLYKMYESVKSIHRNYTDDSTREAYIKAYEDTKIKHKDSIEHVNFNIHFVDGPFLELTGNSDKKYKVQFFDENGRLEYENEVKCNMWTRLNRKYFTKWSVKVFEGNKQVYDYSLDFKGKRVYIAIDSKALGDTLAWFPYVEEFRKKHDCQVVCSTFHNHFFEKTYPEIQFIKPGETAHNIIAKYLVGWFYNTDMEPELPNTIPLQKAAPNILGLEYKEIAPKIHFVPSKRPYEENYVAIATASTTGMRYWTEEGWMGVVNFLKNEGYKVVHISKEGTNLQVDQLQDTSMENTMNVIYHSEFLIGLTSGLAWLNWAMGKKTVMISNSTKLGHEFQNNCVRITDTSVCHGCWNDKDFIFDKGDWNWCPKHKNTPRHFECHRKIKPDAVIEKIKQLL